MLSHLQTPFHSFRKQLHTRHDSFSGCLVESHSTWVYFFNSSNTKKIRACCASHSLSPSPVNPFLIQLAAGAVRHSTLARAAGVQDSQKNVLAVNGSLF